MAKCDACERNEAARYRFCELCQSYVDLAIEEAVRRGGCYLPQHYDAIRDAFCGLKIEYEYEGRGDFYSAETLRRIKNFISGRAAISERHKQVETPVTWNRGMTPGIAFMDLTGTMPKAKK